MPQAKTNASRNVLILLCSLSFILYIDRVNLAAGAGPIKAELGLSNTGLGIAFSAFGYSYAVFQIVGGWFADRYGPKVTLIVCSCIWVIATVATGFVWSLASLFVARLLLGVGEGGTLPAEARAISNWFAKEKRGFVLGFTHACSRLGNAITPPLVAMLILTYSWRVSFVVVGAFTGVWIIIWAVYFQDNPAKDTETGREGAAVVEAGDNPGHAAAATPWKPVLKRMGPAIFVYFCQVWTNTLFFWWLPIFFLHGEHLDLMNSAYFSSIVFCGGVLGDVTGGFLSDQILRRTGNLVLARQSVIVISMVGTLAFLARILFAADLTTITLCLAAAFFFVELTIGPIWAVPLDIAPAFAGTASGMLNTGSAIANIISPIVFGWVVDVTGNWTLPFVGAIVFLILGIIVSFRIRPDLKVAEAM
ncbi:MAG: MFS transporter [Terriglobia bacterium]